MMLRKKGTPTIEVTILTKISVPDTIFLDATAAITIPAPQQRAGGQIEAVIFREHQRRNMGRHQADKTYRPDERHRRRRQDADAQQRTQAQPIDVNTKAYR